MHLAKRAVAAFGLILGLAVSSIAHAASITPADFISPYVDDFTGLGLPYTIHTNLSPLVRTEGIYTFTTSTGTTFRYNDLGGPPYFGETISTDDQIGTIDLTPSDVPRPTPSELNARPAPQRAGQPSPSPLHQGAGQVPPCQ